MVTNLVSSNFTKTLILRGTIAQGITRKTDMTDQQLLFGEDFEDFDLSKVEERIWALESKGDLAGAERIAVDAVTKTRAAQNGARLEVDPLLTSLETRANFYARTGNFVAAKADYLEAVSLVAGKSGNEGVLSRLYGELGYLSLIHI